jgi:N-acetylglucosamine-6-phosphate deacetylase
MTRLLEHLDLLEPGGGIIAHSLAVDGGRVVALDPSEPDPDWQRVDAGGRLVTPGLIDLHVHGWGRWSFDDGPDHFPRIIEGMHRHGVTGVLPTVVPTCDPAGLERMERIAAAVESTRELGSAGLHVEGPFVAEAGAACDTRRGDVGLLDDLLSACRGTVRAMTIAPDVENILPVIERLREREVAVFISHTRADYDQAQRAIDAGARHATHFYDVFYPPESVDGGVRPVGVVEAVLADPRCTVDFIPDGVHVHPGAIKLALAVKGPDGVAVVTDANVGAGLPEGVYDTPWGFPVEVGPRGGARNADPNHPKFGGLAGSALTMDAGLNHLRQWFDRPEEELVAMASSTPARIAGLEGKGRLAVGSDADFVLWDRCDDRLVPRETWIAGRQRWTGENS